MSIYNSISSVLQHFVMQPLVFESSKHASADTQNSEFDFRSSGHISIQMFSRLTASCHQMLSEVVGKPKSHVSYTHPIPSNCLHYM